MRIDYIKEFLVAAEESSISLAAERIHITQPVLSKHIRALEDSIGVQLFLRSPKGLNLTPLGSRVYSSFKQIIEEYDLLLEEVHEGASEICGQLHMGILSTGFDSYVAPAVEHFNKIYPNISFSYSTNNPHNILSRLLDGQIDLGFLGETNLPSGGSLSRRCIGRDKLYVLVKKDSKAAKHGALTPEDARDKTLFCLKTKETTSVVNGIILSSGYNPKAIQEVDEIELAASAVSAHDGFFAIPDFMRSQFKTSQSIEIIDFDNPLFLPVYFAFRTNPSNLVSLFLKSLPLVIPEE